MYQSINEKQKQTSVISKHLRRALIETRIEHINRIFVMIQRHVLTIIGEAHFELASIAVDFVGLEAHVGVARRQLCDAPLKTRAPFIQRARNDDRLVRYEKVAHEFLDAQFVTAMCSNFLSYNKY